MWRTTVIYLVLLPLITGFSPKISLLKPGIKFEFPDETGISLVGLHYSVNKPLVGVSAGEVNVDIRAKSGNSWVHENPGISVQPGNQVRYWYIYVKNGAGHNSLDNVWTAAVPTTTITSTTTTRPTTVAQTTQVRTSQPIVNGGVPSGNSGGNSGGGSDHLTKSPSSQFQQTGGQVQPQQTGTSGGQSQGQQTQSPQQTGTQTGTCGCTGGTSAPACTSYPCLIFEDDFDTLDLEVWEHEITAGGGGNWEFQYYTNNRSNSYVKNGKLFIKPTLTTDKYGDNFLTTGSLDIWGSQPGDVCTSNQFWGCKRDGNGEHIINPIQSARLRSIRGFSFKYGKVEVEAKMPVGDWIWPAVWMLPKRNAYGIWPASGEIDIVESRGNRQLQNAKGESIGVDSMGSTLHFGPDFWHNKYMTAHTEQHIQTGTLADSFHTYGVEWDETHIKFFLDGTEILNVAPTKTMWEYGSLENSNVENPWKSGGKMTPFDQEFYLILNVAVGGTAGYFPDGLGGKPWADKSQTAPRDFWNARGQWYPTWHADKNNGEDAAMQIDRIRVWKLKP